VGGTITIPTYGWVGRCESQVLGVGSQVKLSTDGQSGHRYPIHADHLSRHEGEPHVQALSWRTNTSKVTCLPGVADGLHSVLDKDHERGDVHANKVIKPT